MTSKMNELTRLEYWRNQWRMYRYMAKNELKIAADYFEGHSTATPTEQREKEKLASPHYDNYLQYSKKARHAEGVAKRCKR